MEKIYKRASFLKRITVPLNEERANNYSAVFVAKGLVKENGEVDLKILIKYL